MVVRHAKRRSDTEIPQLACTCSQHDDKQVDLQVNAFTWQRKITAKSVESLLASICDDGFPQRCNTLHIPTATMTTGADKPSAQTIG